MEFRYGKKLLFLNISQQKRRKIRSIALLDVEFRLKFCKSLNRRYVVNLLKFITYFYRME